MRRYLYAVLFLLGLLCILHSAEAQPFSRITILDLSDLATLATDDKFFVYDASASTLKRADTSAVLTNALIPNDLTIESTADVSTDACVRIGDADADTNGDCVCRSSAFGLYADADCDASRDTTEIPLNGMLDPDDVSGLLIWLDADQDDATYNDADAVATIANFGTGPDLTQATGAKQPTFKTSIINGHDVYRFDGGDCAATSSTVEIGTFVVIVVSRFTGTAGIVYEQSAIADSNSGSFMYGTSGSSSAVNRGGTKSGRDWTTNWLQQDQWQVAYTVYRGAHETHRLCWDSCSLTTATAGFGSGDPGTGTATDTLYLGGRNCSSLFVTGDVAEFIVYTTAPTVEEIQAVVAGLKAKYQIQ